MSIQQYELPICSEQQVFITYILGPAWHYIKLLLSFSQWLKQFFIFVPLFKLNIKFLSSKPLTGEYKRIGKAFSLMLFLSSSWKRSFHELERNSDLETSRRMMWDPCIHLFRCLNAIWNYATEIKSNCYTPYICYTDFLIVKCWGTSSRKLATSMPNLLY